MKNENDNYPIEIIEQGSVIDHIDKICDIACKSEFSQEFFEKAKEDIDVIASLLDLTPIQTVIFCILFALNLRSESITMDDILRFTECSSMAIFALQKEFDTLIEKQLIKVFHEDRKRRLRQRAKLNLVEYYVNDAVVESTLMKGAKSDFIPGL